MPVLIEDRRATSTPTSTPAPKVSNKQYEKFTTILDRILVRRLEDEVVAGSIQIASKYRQQSRKGEVLCVGDGVYIGGSVRPMPVKPKDIILFGEYNLEMFNMDGEELGLLRVQDVRGVERYKPTLWERICGGF